MIHPKDVVEALLSDPQTPEQVAQLEEIQESLTDDHPQVVRHKALVKAAKAEEKKTKAKTTKRPVVTKKVG